ncbi:hypothetical protein EZV73_11560 [Acidaminobacter sp. JC074]|uniref:hypothetical protein n=1 Tax=Acidaminobacter sp. JC074 TaxID=2530199 RepID=UPI001F115225|nr:hypothetical protein [Acidaminobacter sp. JC074]MCH4888215.1 hypothetical protein [Acidaminobacter sp. JC074]
MQKKVVWIVVLALVIILAYSNHEKSIEVSELRQDIIDLNGDNLGLKEEHLKLENELSNHLAQVDDLTERINTQELYLDNYESILLEFAKDETFETFLLLNRRNKLLAVETDEGLLTVPYHGNVYTGDESYKIIASISTRDLDYRIEELGIYNQWPVDMRRIIDPKGFPTDYPPDAMTIDVVSKEEESFTIKSISKWLLEMVSDTINIHHTMPDKGIDYFPTSHLELEYNGGFEGEGFVESFEPIEGGFLCRNQQNTAMGSDYTLEVKSDGIYMTSISNSDIGEMSTNKKLLPSDIYEGASWLVDDHKYEIQEMDVLVEVPAGIYKTIKVVTDHDEPKVFYYAPGIGLVRIEFYGLVEELIDIRILER